ncbi:MAG UNVERIFIED_CONTAM: hypothetical protein LVR18_35880 [Planctomycetaceae bacterium]
MRDLIMSLTIRPATAVSKTWDVAGDLLSFLRCGLQYRYSQPGKPRPSHSAQQFSGRFLQQVLEDAWLSFKTPASPSFPYSDNALQELLDHVEQRLAAHGVRLPQCNRSPLHAAACCRSRKRTGAAAVSAPVSRPFASRRQLPPTTRT